MLTIRRQVFPSRLSEIPQICAIFVGNLHIGLFGGGLVAKLCLTLKISWTVACQAPLSMGFSRREYWSGLPFPSPEDLPDPGVKPRSPALQVDDLPAELWGKPCGI